eukprot:5673676-Prymnesium_polylepis.1
MVVVFACGQGGEWTSRAQRPAGPSVAGGQDVVDEIVHGVSCLLAGEWARGCEARPKPHHKGRSALPPPTTPTRAQPQARAQATHPPRTRQDTRERHSIERRHDRAPRASAQNSEVRLALERRGSSIQYEFRNPTCGVPPVVRKCSVSGLGLVGSTEPTAAWPPRPVCAPCNSLSHGGAAAPPLVMLVRPLGLLCE